MKLNKVPQPTGDASKERVLDMARTIYTKVKDIHEEVDTHKRYSQNDTGDPYGEVIAWTHETGAFLFGPYS
tara:strand:- start:54 stop:266 length:213 start_codon:yes stop_codon:yes gene_type:complete